jgi:hypothetical protein
VTLHDRSDWSPLLEDAYYGLPEVDRPPSLTVSVPAWMDRARCLDADPSMFFPSGRGAVTEPARRVCRGCQVRGECLAYALEIDAAGVVMGGLSDGERAKVRLLSEVAA